MTYTREQLDAILIRVEAWERSESNRLRERILVPVFGGNMCVMHNSMIAYEQGKPWREMPANHYKLGRFYEWKQRTIWDKGTQMTKHFYDLYIGLCRQAA